MNQIPDQDMVAVGQICTAIEAPHATTTKHHMLGRKGVTAPSAEHVKGQRHQT